MNASRELSLLIRIRFAHFVLQALALGPALHFGWLQPRDLPYSFGALAALLAFNLFSLAALRRGRGAAPSTLLVQNLADLTAMTVLFGVSGGLTNPLHSLIHFQVGFAAWLLPPRLALAVLAAGCAALAVLASSQAGVLNFNAWIGPLGPNLASEWLLAGVVAGFALFASSLNRRADARLREARERLHQQDRLRAVGATAAGFCHELATPLNASILLGARLRRKSGESGLLENREDWNELEDNLARCERIVRAMAGAPWEPDALAAQRADAAWLARKLATDRAVKNPLAVSIPTGDFTVQAPPVSLGHVLINLLRNAEEASPAEAAIDLALEGDADRVIVRISDRGAGMDPQVLRMLGKPFNTRKGEGRGLGLFSALHLVESLGGSLAFSPRPGGGTIATLTLPRAAKETA